MAIRQEVNSPLIITIGAVSGFLIIVIVIGLQAWFMYEEQTELAEKWEYSPNTALQELRANYNAHLANAGKGHMPITTAMSVLAKTNGKLPATQPQ